jgi:hexulose-6-phosphate isomerase
MNRRLFLSTTAATLLGGALSRAATPGKRQLKKAINLAMLRLPEAPLLERCRIIKDAGFDGIELHLPGTEALDDLLKARDATGLEFAGAICSTHWKMPLSATDPAVVENGMRGLRLALAQAGELGLRKVLLVPGVVKDDVTYDLCWQRSIAAIRRAIPVAEKAGCQICVENVWNQFITKAEEAVRYVDEIAHPSVGWHLDFGNLVTWGQTSEHWVRTLGRRVFNLHIKDFSNARKAAEGERAGFAVELGEGSNDWPAIMRALDEIAYTGYGILEVPGGDGARVKFLAERTDKLFAG